MNSALKMPYNEDKIISNDDFNRMMASIGPFESQPHLAVAVSGGGDSMALCLLADVWARKRGGHISALSVDHQLRRQSGDEVAQVKCWLQARSIDHHILCWRGEKPLNGIQAAARKARYGLMTSWARKAGVLHLMLAHNMQDQGETFIIRLERHSGIKGLSSMAAVLETPSLRLLRPFLEVSGKHLRNTLTAQGQHWLEDPSNRDVRYTRTRIRKTIKALAKEGLDPRRLAAATRGMAQLRIIMENAVCLLLAHCCRVDPAGYAHIDKAILTSAPREVSLRALGRIITCIGARDYSPRLKKLQRLHNAITKETFKTARTLSGCRIIPHMKKSSRRQGILICREERKSINPVCAVAGNKVIWDNRFAVEFAIDNGDAKTNIKLTHLGRNGWAEVISDRPELKSSHIPSAARMSLPTLRDELGVFAVPHLKYKRDNTLGLDIKNIRFAPPNSVSQAGFFLV